MSMPKDFPRLLDLSAEELHELLTDKASFARFLHGTEGALEARAFTRDLRLEIESMARANIALAEADVGIAMAGGVGAASEVASVVLLGDRPSQVVDALELSHATFGKIEQNLCWAFAYNLVGIPIAAGALLPFTGLALTPSVAGGLMGFSSLGVMANSLTLRLAGRRLSEPPTTGRASGSETDV